MVRSILGVSCGDCLLLALEWRVFALAACGISIHGSTYDVVYIISIESHFVLLLLNSGTSSSCWLTPPLSFSLVQLLESHAVDTYATFVQLNCDRLKVLPAPQVAKSYYTSADLYMFDDFQVSRTVGSRRPPCDNMYDVFSNICDDEAEHVKTMQACQEYVQVGSVVVSPHATAVERGTTSDEEHKRKRWLEWAESFQDLDARADDSGDFDN